MLDTPPPKIEEQDCSSPSSMTSSRPIPPTIRNAFCVWKQTLRPFSPHPRFSSCPSRPPVLLPLHPRHHAPPGMRRHIAFAASFSATSGRWDCWPQAVDSPAKPFGTAPPRWPGPPPAPRGIPPARVSACGPPASFGACGFRSGQPFHAALCQMPSLHADIFLLYLMHLRMGGVTDLL